MIRYIPPFVLQNYETNKYQGSLDAYVLLFDIADFTPIGTALQKEGKQGAEELSKFLDVVFSVPIEFVNQYGGFVSVFAGDAFCAVFPAGKPENIVSVVNSITAYFAERTIYKTPFGEFALQVRQTICFGKVDWQIYVNELQNEYVFSGDIIKELAELSHFKEAVIFSEAAAQSIGLSIFEKLVTGYRLISRAITAVANPLEFHYAPETETKFVNPKFNTETPQNEIRSAAYCFADLEGVAADQREKAIELIQSLADKYGGFVNKYDATDKGLVGIILFGLPKSEGKTLERICSFSLDLVESVRVIALGISCGNVYAGYTGSGKIREYTAFGNPMNLSARLMGKARAGEVLTDAFLWQEMHAHYDFDYLGNLNLKGIDLPVRYYKLSRQAMDKAWHQENRFVGRDNELSSIRTLVDKSIESKENTIICVSGDAGIGKSRLVKEALATYIPNAYHKFYITCDAILSKPLEAIKQMVRSYFYYNPNLPEEAGIGMFKALWSTLALSDTEMQRIESIIASLLGYEWKESVWSMLPPEERPNQLKNAFIRFMEQLTKTKPVLIHLDDAQWLDEQSKDHLQTLSEREIKPVIIVTPCRYLESGAKADLELSKHKREDIELNNLSDEGSVELIKTILRLEHVPEDTLSLITNRAMGNPLFIEQLTSYLMENGSINDKGIITGDVGYLSSFSISDIVSSRIDRLTENVRECMFNASVLGTEFNIKVLSQMLKSEPLAELETGVKNRIWKDLDELNYIFTHILIKDIIYQRMLTEKLQKLHQTAAEAMEIVFADKLDENAEEIAQHFKKGKLIIKAADYYDKAGCWFKDKYVFDKAEENLNKALQIREAVLGAEHLDTASTINNLALVYFDQSKYDRAESLYIRTLEIIEKTLGREHPKAIELLHCLAGLYASQGKFEQAELLFMKTLDIGEKVLGKEHPNIAVFMSNLATLSYQQGKNEQAESLFMRALVIGEKVLGKEHLRMASFMNNFALVYCKYAKYDKSLSLCLKALEIREKVLGKEHPETAFSLSTLGMIYVDIKRYSEAEPLYQRALEIWESKLGIEHVYTALALNNLAGLYDNQGRYDQAEPNYLRALEIRENKLGMQHPDTIETLEGIIELYEKTGETDKAKEYQARLDEIENNTKS
jgi:predicted ATPase/class 3 adenylate cyclase